MSTEMISDAAVDAFHEAVADAILNREKPRQVTGKGLAAARPHLGGQGVYEYEAMSVGGEWLTERRYGKPDGELFVVRNLREIDPLVVTSPQALASAPAQQPIAMILYCPNCGVQHVDAPDERTPEWINPPHRSHLCHDCGCIWRPADVATVGVQSIETEGKADTWPVNAEGVCAIPAAPSQPVQGDDWHCMDSAPLNQDVLLHVPSLSTAQVGRWECDQYARKPRPYWLIETARHMGVQWARANQPIAWREVPKLPAAKPAQGPQG